VAARDLGRPDGPAAPGPSTLDRARLWIDAAGMNTDPEAMTVLGQNDCWALLRSTEVGRLAVAVGDRPDIFPINFVVDHGTVVFRTAEGTKLAAAVVNEAVAFEVDGYDRAAGEAWSVVIKGRAQEIRRMQELFDTGSLPLFPWHAAPKQRFVRITPDEVTGRRFHVVDRAAWATATDMRRSAPE
jgi:hypothetical protein